MLLVSGGKWNFWKIVMFLVVTIWVIVWLFPLWNVVISSFKSMESYMSSKPWQLSFDSNPLIQFSKNVIAGLEGNVLGNSILPAFLNSTIYGILGAAVAIICASLAAFALACLRIRARFFFFILLFCGALFPVQIYLIPIFTMLQNSGFYDTKSALTMVYIAICLPFCVFLLRNWYLDIPIEIVEAAKIDGATELQTFTRIFVPLSISPAVTLFLFQFTWVWNDFIFGITFTRSSASRPIMAVLAGLQSMYSNVGIPAVLASTIIASLPTVLLLILFKNTFFKGLAMQYGGSSKS